MGNLDDCLRRLIREEVAAAVAAERAAKPPPAPPVGQSPLMTVKAAAGLLQVSPATVRKLVAAGAVSERRIGRELRIDRQELLAALEPQRDGRNLDPKQIADRILRDCGSKEIREE